MRDVEWLAGLKAGDEVLISGGWNKRLAKVQRVTATQVIVNDAGDRFRRQDGRRVGSSGWNASYLRPPTQQDRDALELLNLREQVERYAKSKDASLPVLRAMLALTKGETHAHD